MCKKNIKNKMEREIRLQIGMRVVIENDKINFQHSASKTKTITNVLPDFGKSRAFALDGDDGIWCIPV